MRLSIVSITLMVACISAACLVPPDSQLDEYPLILPMREIASQQWELEFSVGREIDRFSICTAAMNQWIGVSSLALIIREPDITIILAVQTGPGDLCIMPEDGAFADIVLHPDVEYIISTVTAYDSPEIVFNITAG